MIDYETVQKTGDGTTPDRISALLIGLIAVLAAVLVVVQTAESQREARANANTARLTSELTSRLMASGGALTFQAGSLLRALQVGVEGAARSLVALGEDDAVGAAVGAADGNAGTRLIAIASAMGALPDEDSPLDEYVASLLTTDQAGLEAIAAQQAAERAVAEEAGRRSHDAVLGLSMLALAGVLVGLAAVFGGGRAGASLLGLAWLAAAGSIVLALSAAGMLGSAA